MLVVNFLATTLPINNRSTGDISLDYPNLFAPAGITFSIWGLIYILLGGYVVYQFTKGSKEKEKLLQKINWLFVATSLANMAWIFAWHYDFIGLSLCIMALLLFLLIKIADLLRQEEFKGWEKVFVRAPFSIYFGWITVASIANTAIFLVSLGWNGFGVADFVWTSIILIIGAIIGILRMRKDKNLIYGLVFLWAYFGILLKHLSSQEFDGQYPSIIITLIVCLLALGFFAGKLVSKK